MSTFSRPSDWLRQFFTPSRFGWNPPSQVSDEVSLTQPYDGGGYPVAPANQWFYEDSPAVGAAGNSTLVTMGEDEYGRILACHVAVTAGVLPTVQIECDLAGAQLVTLSETITPAVLSDRYGIEVYCPILPPSRSLIFRWDNGDAATACNFRALVAVVPIGTVFYI